VPLKTKEMASKGKRKCPAKCTTFRNIFMFDFFVMFFYEAALEISVALAFGFELAYDGVIETEAGNIFVKKWNWYAVVTCSCLFIVALVTIVVLMTRKTEKL